MSMYDLLWTPGIKGLINLEWQLFPVEFFPNEENSFVKFKALRIYVSFYE